MVVQQPPIKFQVVHKRVEDMEALPEKVDILISEWMGFYLLHESMLDSVVKARDVHLKDDGIMMPSRAKIYASACSLADLRASTVDYWKDVYGFNMSILQKEALKRTKPEIVVISPDSLLSDPVEVHDLDLCTVTCDDLSNISSKKFVSVNNNANFQGLAIWFDVQFDYWAEGWTNVTLDTSPMALPTHWKQTIIPLFRDSIEEESVEQDEIVGWQLSLARTMDARQYGIQVEVLDPAEVEHPVPCGCKSAKCTLISALLAQEDTEDIDELDGIE